jgi:catechol 2,3-dioxygenase-like lactoylglutathione lyase family enzyme
MAIGSLDHVNIRSSYYEESIRFYRDALGLQITEPPGQDRSDAVWIRSGDGRAAIHLGRSVPGPDFLGETPTPTGTSGSARVHHIAFECSDYSDMRSRLLERGLGPKFNEVEAIGLRQIFVRDPNGILIELNYRD